MRNYNLSLKVASDKDNALKALSCSLLSKNGMSGLSLIWLKIFRLEYHTIHLIAGRE